MMGRIMTKAVLAAVLVFPGLVGAAANSESAESSKLPWSGYWWPQLESALISGIVVDNNDWKGGPSPLQRYDFVATKSMDGPVTQWEKQYHSSSDAMGWWGHCNGWAAAAAMEPEPQVPGKYEGVVFRVGDKKALLTSSHQGDPVLMIGTRYTGESTQDKTDIHPLDFYKALRLYIGTLHQSILMDVDAGIPVWNFPCYRYDMRWEDRSGGRDFVVTCYFADDGVGPDFVGLAGFTKTYTFTLYSSGGSEFDSGEWTNQSADEHPDFLWVVVGRQPESPFMSTDLVDRIAESTLPASLEDDQYEPNDVLAQAAHSAPDGAFGTLLNDDYYRIPVEAGEQLSTTAWTWQLPFAVDVSLLDKNSASVGTVSWNGLAQTIDLGQSNKDQDVYLRFHAAALSPVQNNYAYQIRRNGAQLCLGNLLNLGTWQSTVLLSNPNVVPVPLFPHTLRQEGLHVSKPMVLESSFELEAGGVFLGHPREIMPSLIGGSANWVKIRTAQEIRGCSLLRCQEGGTTGDLSALPFWNSAYFSQVIPHLAEDGQWWTGITLVNADTQEGASSEITLTPYRSNGTFMATDKVKLVLESGGRTSRLVSDYFPRHVLDETDWILVEGTRKTIAEVFYGRRDFSGVEAIQALPMNGALFQMIPWLPGGQDWWSGVVLVNPGNDAVSGTMELDSYGMQPEVPKDVQNFEIGPGQRLVFLAGDRFPTLKDRPGACLKIKADKSFAGFYLYGPVAGGALLGGPLLSREKLMNAAVFPVLPDMALVANAAMSSSSGTLVIDAIGQDGKLLGTSSPQNVPLYSLKKWPIKDLFGGTMPSGVVYVRVRSNRNLVLAMELWDGAHATLFPPVPALVP